MACSVSAQSRKAVKQFEKGEKALTAYEIADASQYFQKAIEIEPDYILARLKLAQIYTQQQKFTESNALLLDYASEGDYRIPQQIVANYLQMENYEQVIEWNNRILSRDDMSSYSKKQAQELIDIAQERIELIGDTEALTLSPLSDNINSETDEYLPQITADYSKLIFVRRMGKNDEDLFEAYWDNEKQDWSKAINMGGVLNTVQKEGAPALSADGRTLVFSRDVGEERQNFDLFISTYDGEEWTTPKALPNPVNTSAYESTPSLSADGRTMIFSSRRRGGKGSKDLWITHQKEDSTWTFPVNLGSKVNTKKSEEVPFLHPNGIDLYFASEGHNGLGGYDIYKVQYQNGEWSEVENLGGAFNSKQNEAGIFITRDGKQAFFGTDREKEKGYDIVYTNLPQEYAPEPAGLIKLITQNANTKERISADIKLINLANSDTVFSSVTFKNGSGLISIPAGANYGLRASKEGFLFFSSQFNLKQTESVQEIICNLSPIVKGESTILRNVFFDLDSDRLQQGSYTELNALVKVLNQNSDLRLLIEGHTDNQGDPEYNLELSRKRAESVQTYLIGKGISQDRLEIKGFGETSPIESNETEEGRAKNRRTTVTVL